MITVTTPISIGNIVSGANSLPSGFVNTTYFYGRITGLLTPQITGLYVVGVNCQDGCNVYLGNTEIVTNLAGTDTAYATLPNFTQAQRIYLTAGIQYPITIEWQHGSGANYELDLLWTLPNSGVTELIPSTCLSNLSTSITGTLDGSFWNGTSILWYPTGNGIVDLSNPAIPNSAALAAPNLMSAPAGDVLISDGTGKVEDSGTLLSDLMFNPMTTEGDMIYESASLGAVRLPIGTSGQTLMVVGGLPAWGTGGSSVSVNGTIVASPNFQDSASVTFAVSGSNISLTTTGSSSKTRTSFLSSPSAPARNNFTGALGYRFQVLVAITVTELGRYYDGGSSNDHVVNLWVDSNTSTPIATATVLAASASDSLGFKWATLSSSVTLYPGIYYYIAVDETSGGDKWNDANTFAPCFAPEIPQQLYNGGGSLVANISNAYSSTPSTFPSNVSGGYTIYDTPAMTFSTTL